MPYIYGFREIFDVFYENARYASVAEAAAAHELAHDAGGRYFFVADGYEVADELQQAVGLGILGAVLRYRGEYELGMRA